MIEKYKMQINKYDTILFDCDGVILDSNAVKANAFHDTALPWGKKAADELVRYNAENGGVSRYKKFEYFKDVICKNYLDKKEVAILDELLAVYGDKVLNGLMQCNIAPGLETLRQLTAGTIWAVVSGGDQKELREVFRRRQIEHYFDGGIFGSPNNKEEIITRERGRNNFVGRILFIGDSRYDHIAASAVKIDFVFMSQWSEFTNWRDYVQKHSLSHVKTLQELCHRSLEG